MAGTNGRATYQLQQGATGVAPTPSSADGILIKSDGTLTGSNAITGNIAGDVAYATLSVTGTHDNRLIDIGIDVGNFAAAIAAETTPTGAPSSIPTWNLRSIATSSAARSRTPARSRSTPPRTSNPSARTTPSRSSAGAARSATAPPLSSASSAARRS